MEEQNRMNNQDNSYSQNRSNSITEHTKERVEIQQKIALFPQRVPERFRKKKPQEKLVRTFPNLIIREVICFQLVVIVVALIALFFDAPLEKLANPNNTPNPAKAPWYFLSIQELLHSFPSVVGGVIIPIMVIVALIAIPYVKTNIKQEGLWIHSRHSTMIILSVVVFAIVGIGSFFRTFSIVIPTLILYCIAVIPFFFCHEKKWISWLSRRSLSEWIMTWFVIVVFVLTIIGTFFRGAGWSWVLPWE